MASSLSTRRFPPAAMTDALASSVTSGSFSDTAYYLYSRRLRNGLVGEPKAVFANSLVMISSAPYFQAQLSGGFSTDQLIPLETENYEYDSDSDLDDSEDQSDDSEGLDGEACSTISMPTIIGTDNTSPSDSTPTSKAEARHLVGPKYKHRLVVPDVASNSWQALVHFIYTGNVHFSPLKSEGIDLRQSAHAAHAQKYPFGPPLCSPKSMFRLADIIGMLELKEMARGQIRARISSKNIAEEVFSRFSSRYRDILDMQLEILYKGSTLAEVMPSVLKIIPSITQGQRPYCEDVVCALFLKLSCLLSSPQSPPQPQIPDAARMAAISETRQAEVATGASAQDAAAVTRQTTRAATEPARAVDTAGGAVPARTAAPAGAAEPARAVAVGDAAPAAIVVTAPAGITQATRAVAPTEAAAPARATGLFGLVTGAADAARAAAVARVTDVATAAEAARAAAVARVTDVAMAVEGARAAAVERVTDVATAVEGARAAAVARAEEARQAAAVARAAELARLVEAGRAAAATRTAAIARAVEAARVAELARVAQAAAEAEAERQAAWEREAQRAILAEASPQS